MAELVLSDSDSSSPGSDHEDQQVGSLSSSSSTFGSVSTTIAAGTADEEAILITGDSRSAGSLGSSASSSSTTSVQGINTLYLLTSFLDTDKTLRFLAASLSSPVRADKGGFSSQRSPTTGHRGGRLRFKLQNKV